jgi:uncharacterized protein
MALPLPRAALTAHFLPAALGALLIAAGFAAGSANAQSFECRYAHYPDERTICQDPALGQLDQELASVYRRVMLKLPRREAEALDKNEDTFVIARRRCGDHRACIEQSYRNRIQELQAAVPEDESDRQASRRAQPKRSARNKTEDERDDAGDGKRGAAETAISSPERNSDQGESGAATAVAPEETRSRHEESAGSGSAVPERLAPASGASAAAASSGKPPEKRHSAKTVSGSSPSPTKTAPTGGTQWVNPSPSP